MPSSKPEDPTKYCCICIPVRYGLLVAAVFAMLLSGALGALGILALDRISEQTITLTLIFWQSSSKQILNYRIFNDLRFCSTWPYIFYLLSAACSGELVCLVQTPFLTIVITLRIYASARKNTTCTSVFTAVIIGQMVFSLASGALCIYILFDSTHAWAASKCLTIAFDPFTKNLCRRTPVFKGLTIGFLSMLWIVEIGRWMNVLHVRAFSSTLSVAVIVGTSFLSQLREETMQLELVEPKYGSNGFYVWMNAH